MADYLNSGNINFTGATWNLAETGSGAAQTTKSGSTASTTSFVYSSAFTITNTDVVDGVLLHLNGVWGTGGTFTVSLYDGTTDVKTVTCNVSDLPNGSTNFGWVFFKFSSSYTSTGLATMKIGVKSSIAAGATVYRDGTAGNWSRVIRRTATGTPVAADNLYVVGDLTAAATLATGTVTMNNTATTAFGKIDICNGGIINWGTTASTAYYLKTAGVFEIWSGGLMNMGTSVTPVPSTSTAELEFVNASNVDRGLEIRGGGIFKSYGATKTLKCKLQGATATISNRVITSSTATITTSSAHGFQVGDIVTVAITGYDASYDGRYTILSVPLTTTFTYTAVVSSGTSTAGAGTVTKAAKSGQAIVVIDDATHTGWANSDSLAISTTSNIQTEGEAATISSMSGATITLTGNLTNTHEATSPYQGDVINLTQNVKIHGTSTTFEAYVNVSDYGQIVCAYTWFYNMGSSTTNKRGIDYQNTQGTSTGTGASSFSYCSMSSFTQSIAVSILTATNATNLTVDNCVTYCTGSGYGFYVFATSSVLIFTNNVLIATGGPTAGIGIADNGSTYTGNIISGFLGGVIISESSATQGTFSNNFLHGNSNIGISITGSPLNNYTFTNCNLIRHASHGMYLATLNTGFTVETSNFIGNGTSGINFPSNTVDFIIKNCVFYAGNQYGQSYGLNQSTSVAWTRFTVSNTTFGYPYKHSISDVVLSNSSNPNYAISFHNCLFYSTLDFTAASLTNQFNNLPIGLMSYNQVAGAHKCYKRYGTVSVDYGIYYVSPSERLTPNTAGSYLESSSKLCTIDVSTTRAITVKVRTTVASDGALYNGGYPTLVAKANPSIGIYSDTILATCTSAASGAWQTLSVSSAAATANGILELVVRCDGTTGFCNVDSWTIV